MLHFCTNSVDNFCYVCGRVTLVGQKPPHIFSNKCACNLRNWINCKGRSIPFALPMIWREPKDHITDSYFCLVLLIKQGISIKEQWTYVRYRTEKGFLYLNYQTSIILSMMMKVNLSQMSQVVQKTNFPKLKQKFRHEDCSSGIFWKGMYYILVVCNNIDGLMMALNIDHNPQE
ncbi:hypothetical protein PR048_012697 [Dryococelus australis]|uniref:Uncharacterized protein n=1 Tax=Dryococelus australis TaxID=614101 RepID=A0ABQ9HQ42_9NEOP|nr:hypothetical protein PR048_012697 [Dryococelus australis]